MKSNCEEHGDRDADNHQHAAEQRERHAAQVDRLVVDLKSSFDPAAALRALTAASALTGAATYWPESRFRQCVASGRIGQ